MDDRSEARYDPKMLSEARGARAARYAALERQKRELRRERDALLIALARHGGEQGLAASLQVAPEVAAKLLADARGRAGAEAADEASVGRPGLDAGARDAEARWAEADTYYEALGSGPPTTFSRRGAWRKPRR